MGEKAGEDAAFAAAAINKTMNARSAVRAPSSSRRRPATLRCDPAGKGCLVSHVIKTIRCASLPKGSGLTGLLGTVSAPGLGLRRLWAWRASAPGSSLPPFLDSCQRPSVDSLARPDRKGEPSERCVRRPSADLQGVPPSVARALLSVWLESPAPATSLSLHTSLWRGCTPLTRATHASFVRCLPVHLPVHAHAACDAHARS